MLVVFGGHVKQSDEMISCSNCAKELRCSFVCAHIVFGTVIPPEMRKDRKKNYEKRNTNVEMSLVNSGKFFDLICLLRPIHGNDELMHLYLFYL